MRRTRYGRTPSLYPKRSTSRNVVHCYIYGYSTVLYHHHHAPCWTEKRGGKTRCTVTARISTCGCCVPRTGHSGVSTVGPDLSNSELAAVLLVIKTSVLTVFVGQNVETGY